MSNDKNKPSQPQLETKSAAEEERQVFGNPAPMPTPDEARAQLAASVEHANRRDVKDKRPMTADPERGIVFNTPGPDVGGGMRVQNVSDHVIGGILPGHTIDVSKWDARKLDRLRNSAAYRAEHLTVLNPGDKLQQFEEPKFARLSRHKELAALDMVAAESDAEKLRFWLSDDQRSAVQQAIQERLRASR